MKRQISILACLALVIAVLLSVCSCNLIFKPEPPVEEHTHEYSSAVTKEATCLEAGVLTYTCSCGDSYDEAIPAKGHADADVDYVCDVCGAELEGKPEPEPVFTKVYLKNTAGWEKVYVYAWNESGANNGAWPGVEITLDEADNLYSAEISDEFTSVIFNNGNGGEGNQTADLVMPVAGDFNVVYDNTAAAWTTYALAVANVVTLGENNIKVVPTITNEFTLFYAPADGTYTFSCADTIAIYVFTTPYVLGVDNWDASSPYWFIYQWNLDETYAFVESFDVELKGGNTYWIGLGYNNGVGMVEPGDYVINVSYKEPEVDPNAPKTHEFHYSQVEATEDKAAIPEGTTYADGYFTVVGEVTQRVKDGAVYCIEVQKQGRGAIQFTVTGTAAVEVQFSSTGGSNTSYIGLADAEGNLIANNEGITTVTGASDGMTVVTYNLTAGTYSVVSPDGEDSEIDKRGARVFYVTVVETPVQEPETVSGELIVETTDTYGYIDAYSFTAPISGTYTFTLPAGLGFYSKANYDSFSAPEVDFYDNAEGASFDVALAADTVLEFYVGSTERGTWKITYTGVPGEVDTPDNPPVDETTELFVGPNSVYLSAEEATSGKTFTFVVTEEGNYTFKCDLLAVITDSTGMMVGRGQAYLTAGTYTVALVSMMPGGGNFNVNIVYEAPATGEPDGSEQYPFVWETLPESVTFISDNSNKVYYVFTATADGSVTFTWAVEDNDWFDYFELVDGATTENNASGYAKTSHTFVVEAGKTYRVGLGTWTVGGETVVNIAFNSCTHVWSEATCTAPATCANCGATTGDKAEHTPNTEEPTCAAPSVCTVCGVELGYVDHTWGEPTDVIPADCSTMTDGSQKVTCTVCGHEETETLWAYHSWDYSQCVEATCTTNGNYHAVCTTCGTVDSYVIEATGHENWYLGCGEEGPCYNCGETFLQEHASLQPADCLNPGYCYACGQTVGEALGHKFDETGLCTECYLWKDLVIAGSGSFFGSNWVLEDQNNFLAYDYNNNIFTKTYISAATGVHEFKIVDVTNAFNWDHCYPSSNYCFYAYEGDEVVISINLVTKAVSCTVNGVATTGDLYLVVGDSGLCGDVVNTENEGWGWELENHANLLNLNAEGKFQLVYTGVNAGEYGIKVVKNFSWDNQWGNNGENYMIKVDANNSIVTITFDPATGISHTVHAHEFMYACDAHCMTCGELVNENAAHTVAHVEAKAATCYDNGNLEHWYCEICGQAWLDEACLINTNLMAVVLPMGHGEIVHVEAKAATCTANGNIEYWYCSAEDCGQAWLDADCMLNTNLKAVVLAAAGHADENGDYKCDVCSTKMLPEAGTALTIPQALAIAKLHGHNTYTTQKYYITGIITGLYNTQYGNFYIKDADGNEICIYGLYTYDGSTRYDAMSYKPVNGDEITVYTVLGMYNSTAQGKNAWMDDVVMHEHNYDSDVKDATCTNDGYTTYTCTICNDSYTDDKVAALGHTTENGTCERCNQVIGGDAPIVKDPVTFELGANGSASHNDGTDLTAPKTYTEGSATLKITSATKVYSGARDAKGNSCLKLGTSKLTGTFTFTVDEDVTSVIIYVAGYKAATSTNIKINGTAYTVKTASNNGEYTAIEIDTTTTKTITFTTVTYRCMVNSITYNYD